MEEVVGYFSELWKDVTITKGLSFANLDKVNYKEMVEYLISTPLPRPYRRKQVRDTESFLY